MKFYNFLCKTYFSKYISCLENPPAKKQVHIDVIIEMYEIRIRIVIEESDMFP
jgi:hypothetical protein